MLYTDYKLLYNITNQGVGMGDTKHDQAINDDQELASVLQNMQGGSSKSNDQAKKDELEPEMSYEETPSGKDKDDKAVTDSAPLDVVDDAQSADVQRAPLSSTPTVTTSTAPVNMSSLEALKRTALEELRPLATKLDLPAKEKFDTMLLIIRSTDDQNLLEPAHEAAKNIESDVERAEALLDIVKEIDYFASQGK